MTSPTWPRLQGTFVDHTIAEWVLAGMTNYIRLNGQTMNGEYASFIHALEADVKGRHNGIPVGKGPALHWLPVKLAAQRVGVTGQAVRDRVKNGQLVSKKLAGKWFVTQASVDRWCNERADLAEMSTVKPGDMQDGSTL